MGHMGHMINLRKDAKLPASSTATGAASRRTTKSRRRSLVTVSRPASARQSLAGNHHLAFHQIAFDHFGRGAISQTDLDPAAFWLAVCT